MEINGLVYDFVVTSANDFEYLSLECTSEEGLLLEAELVSYKERKAIIHFHKSNLPFAVLEEFSRRVAQELKEGAGNK